MTKDIENYLEEHQLDAEIMKAWRIVRKHDALEILVRDLDGNPKFRKHRHFSGPAKYTYDRGAEMELYGGFLITKDTTDVFVVEGELKAVLLNERIGTVPGQHRPHMTVAVSSTGGSKSFRDEWLELFRGTTVHILFDNDNAGREGAMSLWRRIQKHPGILGCEVLAIPDGYKDVNELFHGTQGLSWDIVIPERVNMQGIRAQKRIDRVKGIRNFFAELTSYEFSVYTEIHRWFVNEARRIGRDEYVSNRITKKKMFHAEDHASLEEVKKVPITSMVEFRGGVARCVFHADSNPSMHYNGPESAFPNTVKCYACGKFGDVIDVVQALNNVDFRGALEILRKETL